MSLRRPLSSLGLAVPVVTKLLDADFVYDDDVQSLKPTELSAGKKMNLDRGQISIRHLF